MLSAGLSAASGVLDPEEAKRRIEETLRANAERPLFSGTAVSDIASTLCFYLQVPDDFCSMMLQRCCPTCIPLHQLCKGTCYRILDNATCYPWARLEYNMRLVRRVCKCFSELTVYPIQEYEEVTVPPARVVPPRASERLIPVAELDPLAKGSFPVRVT